MDEIKFARDELNFQKSDLNYLEAIACKLLFDNCTNFEFDEIAHDVKKRFGDRILGVFCGDNCIFVKCIARGEIRRYTLKELIRNKAPVSYSASFY